MAEENTENSEEEVKQANCDQVVLYVEDVEQANEYKTLLESNDIPVSIEDRGEKGIAIMVPEYFLDEAQVVLESQDAYDDFYDFALEDEEGDDVVAGGDLFEDEF